jgi:hypothetical protein
MGDPMTMTTPTTLDDVTAEWISEALGTEVRSLDVDPIAAGEGFMGQLARVRIESPDPATPATVIVKLPTADPGGRMIGEMSRVWEREHRFYREVAGQMNVRIPRALANLADPPCLILEDLAPAVPGDHVAGATLDQAERSIDVLARHHANWFEHPLLASLDWMPGLDDPMVGMIGAMFDTGWPVFLDRYGDELPARTLRWCEEFVTGIPEWIAGHFDEPITMTHGDFRLDNLFFFDDGDVGVIDWQMSMRAPGQADLVYFCANNLTEAARREHERDLIERYVEGLHAGGVPSDAVTLDGVWRGYLEGLVFYAVSFGASLLTINPANERGVALFDALVRRTFTAVDDLDAGTRIGLAP